MARLLTPALMLLTALGLAGGPGPAAAEAHGSGEAAAATSFRLMTSQGEMQVSEIVGGLNAPWAFAFLPKGGLLITERGGRLLHLQNGELLTVGAVPKVAVAGQGGLLDVLVPSDFAQSRELWLTWVEAVEGGFVNRAGRARLSADGAHLEALEPLFTGSPAAANRHFGSRLVEAEDGSLFLTTGDRGTGPEGLEAQDPTLSHGKVIQLRRDGSLVPGGFAEAPGIWSLGHRNIQGAALRPDGGLLISEHGARGGDEINLSQAGGNYGWPLISYGVNYDGSKIGQGHAAEGMQQPLHYWDPSIAPSGLMVYSGALIPAWRGDVFTGSLKADFLSRLDPDVPGPGGWAEERLQSAQTGRVRDLREGPDGAIWFLSETAASGGGGALFRLAPLGE